MKKEKIQKHYLFEGLGMPIMLLNVPMKEIFGEWVLDIDLNKFQKSLLEFLTQKPTPLSGPELRFIRKYLGMTTTEFGKIIGMTHSGVIKYESCQSRLNPATEAYIRLYVFDHLNKKRDSEFRKLYHNIDIDSLKRHRRDKDVCKPMEINAEDFMKAC